MFQLLLFMYMERLKKKRAAAARNQNIEIGEGNQSGEQSLEWTYKDNERLVGWLFSFFAIGI